MSMPENWFANCGCGWGIMYDDDPRIAESYIKDAAKYHVNENPGHVVNITYELWLGQVK